MNGSPALPLPLRRALFFLVYLPDLEMSEDVKEEEKKEQLWHCLKRKLNGEDMKSFSEKRKHMERHGCKEEHLVECSGTDCKDCPL